MYSVGRSLVMAAAMLVASAMLLMSARGLERRNMLISEDTVIAKVREDPGSQLGVCGCVRETAGLAAYR